MRGRTLRTTIVSLIVASVAALPHSVSAQQASAARNVAPLAVGETFTVESRILGESRRINVYRPAFVPDTVRLPVLYLLDGGIAEDFLHIAGIVQVSVGNGTVRPMMLVGVENTQRRRDFTGPTWNDNDRKIAPVVGGSASFRKFVRDELKSVVAVRYAVTSQSGVIGESLAGLFVVETLLVEPEMFDTYIAVDPSLWWNDARLVQRASGFASTTQKRTLYVASSSEPSLSALAVQLAAALKGATGSASLTVHHVTMPNETHATIFHPAALQALRTVFEGRARE